MNYYTLSTGYLVKGNEIIFESAHPMTHAENFTATWMDEQWQHIAMTVFSLTK